MKASAENASMSGTIRDLGAGSAEKEGERISRYKLLEKIGEGGMGRVWLAEQIEPIRRQVAIKVIKVGIDSAQILARFEAERQALALMDHPNIARVFDAGATPAGAPYFVMELVKGASLVKFCEAQRLSIPERLRLFVQVCQAIQHAHQKGIIHRDIKPSNVLVALYDGQPVPKVIDFGVAKATEQRLTERTLFTRFGVIVGTPEYMSPEQAELNQLDIDTRSDVYSLGVLLYELLTGTTPLSRDDTRRAAFDEILRRIREDDPPRPSTVLTKATSDLPAVSAQRSLAPRELLGLLRGDLDWIAMKALEKDRSRRYETANAFLLDIERFLTNEPVVARPPSRIYRLQKLARRNRLSFASGVAAVVILILGLAVSTWLLVKERRARERADDAERAQRESRRKAEISAESSRQVAKFLKDMLEGVGPSVALGRDTTMLREILDKTAVRVGRDLTNQPAVEAELLNSLGEAYWRLGEPKEQARMHESALALRKDLYGEEHKDVAESLNNLGVAYIIQRRPLDAQMSFEKAIAILRKVPGDNHTTLADALGNLSWVMVDKGELESAEKAIRECLSVRRQASDTENEDFLSSLDGLGAILIRQGRSKEAEVTLRDAITICQRLFEKDHPVKASLLATLALAISGQGNLPEAESRARDALAMRRRILPAYHNQLGSGLIVLARILYKERKLPEAELLCREALAIQRKTPDRASPDTAEAMRLLSQILDRQKKFTEAESLNREEFSVLKRTLGKDHPDVASTCYDLVHMLMEQGKTIEAESIMSEMLSNAPPTRPRTTVLLLRTRADLLARTGRWLEAAKDIVTVIESEPGNYEDYHVLAPVLIAQHDYDALRMLCDQIIKQFRGATNVHITGRMAKDSLSVPIPGIDLVAARQFGTAAVEQGAGSSHLPYYQFAKGLAEYRGGNFKETVDWTDKVTAVHHSQSASKFTPYLFAQNYALGAMAFQKLNQPEEAKQALSNAVSCFEIKNSKVSEGNLGIDWADWVFTTALLSEAKELLTTEFSPPDGQDQLRKQ